MGPKGVKAALVVIAILAGMVAALVTGILVRSGGGSATSAALSGGGAFTAADALVLTIVKFLELLLARNLNVWRGQVLSLGPCQIFRSEPSYSGAVKIEV